MVGLSPRFLPRGNGVICDIGRGDRVIALRADLDALPLQDSKGVPYRSAVAGVSSDPVNLRAGCQQVTSHPSPASISTSELRAAEDTREFWKFPIRLMPTLL